MEIRRTASAEETMSFYSKDFPRRVRARTDGNLRIDAACNFLLKRVRADSRILDIGCGIGIATERMAKKASAGSVVACDISPEHIDYCRKTIKSKNISFQVIDIIRSPEKLSGFGTGKFDLITLVDVLEHLPPDDSIELFKLLGDSLSDHGSILITIPSPEYQKTLYEDPNERLQAIDLLIELGDILKLAEASGTKVVSYSYVRVWKTNQYIHCEMSRNVNVRRSSFIDNLKDTDSGKASYAIVTLYSLLRTFIKRPFMRRKYVLPFLGRK